MVKDVLATENHIYKISSFYLFYFLQKSKITNDQLEILLGVLILNCRRFALFPAAPNWLFPFINSELFLIANDERKFVFPFGHFAKLYMLLSHASHRVVAHF